ncbi:MAG: hypothetical protein CMH57_00955 [Myxococcales bacterium]|nr:hypothetical protein [Myxococcales bacterium]
MRPNPSTPARQQARFARAEGYVRRTLQERRFARRLWRHLAGRELRDSDRPTLFTWLGAMYLAGLGMPLFIDPAPFSTVSAAWITYHVAWVAPLALGLTTLLRPSNHLELFTLRRDLEIMNAVRALCDGHPDTTLRRVNAPGRHQVVLGQPQRQLTLSWSTEHLDDGLQIAWQGPTTMLQARLEALHRTQPWRVSTERPQRPSDASGWHARITPPEGMGLSPGVQASMATAAVALLIPALDPVEGAAHHREAPHRRLSADVVPLWEEVPALPTQAVLSASAALALTAVLAGVSYNIASHGLNAEGLVVLAQALTLLTLTSAIVPLSSSALPPLARLARSWCARRRLSPGARCPSSVLLSPEGLRLVGLDGAPPVAIAWSRPWRLHLFRTGRDLAEGVEVTLRLYQDGDIATLTTALPEALVPDNAQRLDQVGARMHPAEWLEGLCAARRLQTAFPSERERVAAAHAEVTARP